MGTTTTTTTTTTTITTITTTTTTTTSSFLWPAKYCGHLRPVVCPVLWPALHCQDARVCRVGQVWHSTHQGSARPDVHTMAVSGPQAHIHQHSHSRHTESCLESVCPGSYLVHNVPRA